jgi:hypothetical protein
VLGLDTIKYHALSDDTVNSPDFYLGRSNNVTEYGVLCQWPERTRSREAGLALGMWTAKT